MPGWDTDPNVDAAETLAFGFDLFGDRETTFGQFPVEDSTDKVDNFFEQTDGTNISIRFDNTKFPES